MDMGAEARDIVRKRFPDRPAWFVARSGDARNRFVVSHGPLPALAKTGR